MKVITDPQKIEEVLSRGVHEVFTKEELRKQLLSGKQLHFKLGTDVTGALLHLGHAVIHRKLRDFQELGHKVTLIIGDFTTLVGDHSDKVDMREEITLKEIKKNEKTYQDQFFKTVLRGQTKIKHNSKWLKKLDFNDVINLMKHFSLAQMLNRESFMLRYKAGKEIGLDEFMYPLMQGYDSVALGCDVELGGTDQTFNLLAGRHIMPSFGQKPQCAIVMKLLLGSDGKPMGKSLKNFIPINAGHNEMYGQVMSIIDDVIFDYFELVTRIPLVEIEKMKQQVAQGENPMIFKKKLAYEIASFYHGNEKARQAEENFSNTFQKGEIPEEIDEIDGDGSLGATLVSKKIVVSMSDWRRLVDEGAVKKLSKSDEEKITDFKVVATPGVYKIGKHRFVKIK
ncbi:tyrosine--tRNA ligase [Candidatus Nomurabacteria bacterium CG10_big_fil_rev_8_21_14_0_10_35_16]|uniref:Tyrosine--tRNA ligase n=1 Tax=Candidatus Nomurabacteria bacterium CG10_big_fil_rev_8_21_14_0_10_35_16 TaxID=1974731 RepID=A0A2H0TBG4_9BACT|nr:MAG: tyrosine--tRNA ligase [Candidatus Nomurabacteria bacterium CG10_big_fil_rev_8_21_14_0_10_35_16]